MVREREEGEMKRFKKWYTKKLMSDLKTLNTPSLENNLRFIILTCTK